MEDDFVTIAEFPNVSEAQLYQELLEENGIDPFLPEETMAALQYPPMMGSGCRFRRRKWNGRGCCSMRRWPMVKGLRRNRMGTSVPRGRKPCRRARARGG